MKVTELDVSLTIVKGKSSNTPLMQLTPSAAGYSWENVMPHETPIGKWVHVLQGSSGPKDLVRARLFPPWSYKKP